jgi:hypothetical protein
MAHVGPFEARRCRSIRVVEPAFGEARMLGFGDGDGRGNVATVLSYGKAA